MHSFKRTLWKMLAFVLLVILVTEVITEPYFQNEIFHYQDATVRDSFAGTLDVLICGSSHAYRGISPQMLDEKLGCCSYNLSTSLMTMTGRYEMLKRELDRNPVNLVILDVSYNSMTRDRDKEGPEGDLYQLGRYTNLLERMSYFFRHFRLNEYGRAYYDTLNRGVTAWRKLLNGEGKRGSSDKYQTKGWQPAPSDFYPIVPIVEEESFHTKALNTQFNAQDVEYMRKMVELCKERDIAVIVVAVPITQYMTLMYSGMDEIYEGCCSLFQEWEVPFYDFNLYRGKTKLFPDETAYYDINHLSESGARAFTGELITLLEALKAGTDTTAWFYTSYSEAEQAALGGYDQPVTKE